MDRDITAADQRGSSADREHPRSRMCRYALLFGALGGAVIGARDVMSYAAGGWGMDISNNSPDVPMFWMVNLVDGEFHFLTNTAADIPFWTVAPILYWAVMGAFFAVLFCLVWTGWKRLGVAAFRRAILFGAVAGVVIAAVNLAMFADSREPDYLRILNWPFRSLLGVVERQVRLRAWMSNNVYTCYRLLVAVGYWAAVGSFLAMLFCLLRAAAGRLRRNRS